MKLNALNAILSTLPENMFTATKPMYRTLRVMRGIDSADDPGAEDAVAAERASARELYALKRAVSFLCDFGAGEASYIDAQNAGVIPVGDGANHLPGQIVLTSDESPAQAVEWLLSFNDDKCEASPHD
ncbi:MAG: hypothetical protein IT475_13135 [Aquimonas sp.]|nr:hypothetical protein [Aquimonas sp.]